MSTVETFRPGDRVYSPRNQWDEMPGVVERVCDDGGVIVRWADGVLNVRESENLSRMPEDA